MPDSMGAGLSTQRKWRPRSEEYGSTKPMHAAQAHTPVAPPRSLLMGALARQQVNLATLTGDVHGAHWNSLQGLLPLY